MNFENKATQEDIDREVEKIYNKVTRPRKGTNLQPKKKKRKK